MLRPCSCQLRHFGHEARSVSQEALVEILEPKCLIELSSSPDQPLPLRKSHLGTGCNTPVLLHPLAMGQRVCVVMLIQAAGSLRNAHAMARSLMAAHSHQAPV